MHNLAFVLINQSLLKQTLLKIRARSGAMDKAPPTKHGSHARVIELSPIVVYSVRRCRQQHAQAAGPSSGDINVVLPIRLGQQ